MNKLNIKKLMIVVMIAISAIACLGMIDKIGAISNRTACESVQAEDLGLEYKDGWYLINSARDYYTMQNNLRGGIGQSANYKLMQDITVKSSEEQKYITNTGLRVFSGTFNGNGHEIKQDLDVVSAKNESHDDLGLEYEHGVSAGVLNMVTSSAYSTTFDEVSNAEIKGLKITIYTKQIEAKNIIKQGAIGGLVGYASDTKITNCYVEYSGTLTGAMVNGGYLGGLIGYAVSCTISNTIVESPKLNFIDTSIFGRLMYVGGIIGAGTNNILSNCLVTGDVSMDTNAGPLDTLDVHDFSNDTIIIDGGSYPTNNTTSNCFTSRNNGADFFRVSDGNKGGIYDKLPNLITGLNFYEPGVTEWVLVKGVNGTSNYGEIIQACHVDIFEVDVYNIKRNGEVSESNVDTCYMCWGAYWEQVINPLKSSGGLEDDTVNIFQHLSGRGLSTIGEDKRLEDLTTLNTDASNRYYVNAVWKDGTLYTLTINPNEGTWGGKSGNSTIQRCANITYDIQNPIRAGYAFTGWTKTGLGTLSNSGESYTFTFGEGNAFLEAGWEIVEYYLEVDPNGGEWEFNSSISTINGKYGETQHIGEPDAPTGYSFCYWQLVEGPGTVDGTYFTYGDGDAKIKAIWIANTYTVSIAVNDSSLGSVDQTSITGVPYGSEITVSGNTITIEGITVTATKNNIDGQTISFTGWDKASGYKITGPTTITANFTAITNSYTLTIRPNGGIWEGNTSDSIVEQNYNTTKTISDPTRNGYTFAGWDKTGEGSFNASTKVYTFGAGNGTLTAKWNAVYSITYNLNDGAWVNGYTATTSYTIETSVTLPTANNVTRTGHSFGGWFETSNFSGSAVTNIPTGSTGNKTYYAKWNVETYIITYNLNDGAWVSGYTATTSYTIETSVTLPTASNVTRTGRTFGGWFGTSNFSGSAVTSIPTGSTGNKTYYAKWNAVSYTITYNLNDGAWVSGYTATTSYTIETSVTLPTASNVTRTGHSFGGWFGTSNFSGGAVTSVPTGSTGNKIYYAKWNPNTYTVTYSATNKAGTLSGSGTMTLVSVVYGTEYTAPNCAYTAPNGYEFSHWLDSKNSSWADWIGKPWTWTYTENITMHAEWKEIEYTITTDENNGTSVDNLTYKINRTGEQSKTIGTTTRTGYSFVRWEITINSNGSNSSISGSELTIPANAYGNITIKAVWDLITYYITLDTGDGGEIKNYVPNGVGYDSETQRISYTIEDSAFNLPTMAQSVKKSHDLVKWKLTSNEEHNFEAEYAPGASVGTKKYGNVTLTAEWKLLKYNITLKANGGRLVNYTFGGNSHNNVEQVTIEYTYQVDFKLPTTSQTKLAGHTVVKWNVESAEENWSENAPYTPGQLINDRRGNVTLVAEWKENSYKIVLNANNSTNSTKEISSVKYSSEVELSWEVEYAQHVFVGWATEGYQTTQTYQYIDTNYTPNNIVGNYGRKILINGGKISKVTEGDVSGTTVFNIYAIWLPIYTVTIDANGSEMYENGILVNKTEFTELNHYYQGYSLYNQLESELFNTPTTGNGKYRLHKYGYHIDNWIINVGNKQYYVESETLNPLYGNWKETSDVTKLVKSNTNLQYLQGDIVAIPQWRALEFDVKFVTKSTEEYKANYKGTQPKVSRITFNQDYVISSTSSIVVSNTNIVLAENILGYTVVYAHPYTKQDSLDISKVITIQDTWDYRLDYRKDANNIWYVVIEGYYNPDLYRLHLDLQLPYSTEVTLNNNDFTLVEESFNNLQSKYSALTLDEDGKYITSTAYTDRQEKIYKAQDTYYIYLLQDQKIEERKIYNIYEDGKSYTDTTGIELPNFEIPYYQMQYYYTFNNLNAVYQYQMSELDDSHQIQAREKLTTIGAESINDVIDWKYDYCSTNQDLNDFVLRVYWYRNIVNVQLNNLLEDKSTFNGYVLITEHEQVTNDLIGHNKYNLVIYEENEDVYNYVIYGFNDETILKTSNKYEYLQLLDKSEDELEQLRVSVKSVNYLSIYFGNKIELQAIDQSKDHSLDAFIGYRFSNYEYLILNKLNTAKEMSIDEFDSYINNGTDYLIEIDLRDYEHEYNNNTTNYFDDKDLVVIDSIFSKIQYQLTYQVTDNDNNLQSKHGTIKFEYKSDTVESSQFNYVVTVDNVSNLTSRINLRLGSELYEWRVVNPYAQGKITEEQTSHILVNAGFLRKYLYLNIEGEAATQYSSNAQQVLCNVNASCGDIDFEIKVKVNLLTSNEIIREYLLEDAEENCIFTIKDESGARTNTINIDKSYTINMLSRKAEDTYLYYYQDNNQYALRNLYLAHSLSHSTNLLVNEFGYPVQAIDNINMNVTNELLDGSINYTQFIEVSNENRYLVFYVQVSPVVNITFESRNHEYEKNQESRAILINDIVVLNAEKGNEMLSQGSYQGYEGQEILIKAVTNPNYYTNAELIVEYQDDQINEFDIIANSNIKYTIINSANIIVTFVPRIYTFTASVKYNNEEYGVGEYGIIENASGVKIFDSAQGITIKADKDNIDPTNGRYYYGDKVNITYKLNDVLKNDHTVTLYNSGIKMLKNTKGEYVAEFTGKDIQVDIIVDPKTEEVVLTTNMSNVYVAQIYAQVNDGDMEIVQDATTNGAKKFTLINGDKINVYIKAKVGYRYTCKYEYNDVQNELTSTAGQEGYEDYIKVTLLAEGFDLSKSGWYYLIFEEIAIHVEFKYYVTVPTVQEAQVGENYTASSESKIIKEGSKVVLTKGQDKEGYRFVGYSYSAPQQIDGSKEFVFRKIDETQEEFVVEGDVIDYLEGVGIQNNKITLVVYVNYIKQYKIDYIYECDEALINITTKDLGNKTVAEGEYRDYKTDIIIDVQAVDIEHYNIEIILDNGSKETFNTETMDNAEFEEDSVKLSNIGKLSGFKVRRELINDYKITIRIVAEKYDTQLVQKLYKEINKETNDESTNLIAKEQGVFHLYENIYYKVESSHNYGTEVKVTIFVLKPVDKDKQYYMLSKATLNGNELDIGYEGEGVQDNEDCYIYTLNYSLVGNNLPLVQTLDVEFNALYYVEIGY